MKIENIQELAESLWAEYCEIFPQLVKFDCPKIVYNNRFRSTAGVCYAWQNKIELASKFMLNNRKEMLTVILPHEMAHQIDFNLNGDPSPYWHRPAWKLIMVKIGQNPARCHSMKI